MTDGVAWIGKKSVVDAYNKERKARQLRSRNRASGIKNDDLASESEEEEEYVPWPRISDQVLVSTTDGKAPTGRSEEHTSELQSLMRISYAVFCLNKKKT